MTTLGTSPPTTADATGDQTPLCTDVRQALREIGRDGLAEALSDREIATVLAAQDRLLARALASGYVDEVALGGLLVHAASGPAERNAYLVQAARDRLAFGRGWLAEALIPPWRQPHKPDATLLTTMAGYATWLVRLVDGEGVPDRWTTQDTLRWLPSERERVARDRRVLRGRAGELGLVAALLAELESRAVQRHRRSQTRHRHNTTHQPAGSSRHNRKRGHHAA